MGKKNAYTDGIVLKLRLCPAIIKRRFGKGVYAV